MTQHFYSTQTHLADKIAQTVYGQYFVYVAGEFDASTNDPSSNPKIIRELWCRVSVGELIYANIWFDHKQKLKAIALNNDMLSDDLKTAIHLQILDAEIADAFPVVYIIPRDNIAPSRIRPSDFEAQNYPDNVEYIIPDLRDSDDFIKDRTPCEESPDL
ncbi:MAG: hypothetical protein K8L97_20780 [Anaerolineae bacterium]|nr:hypothetical protein [Anaerolineae bacterium]